MTIAMYLRLSSEDGDLRDSGKAESESISNQRALLQKDRKSTRLNSSHVSESRMPSSA